MISFNTSTRLCFNISSPIDATSSPGTFFFVGRSLTGRMIALGGATPTYGSSFFGWTGSGDTTILFRNSADAGVLAGATENNNLGVVAVVKNGSIANTYINSLTYTQTTGLSGSFIYQKIGARDYLNVLNSQTSNGYLGDVIYYNRALSDSEIQLVITTLKAKYGIA